MRRMVGVVRQAYDKLSEQVCDVLLVLADPSSYGFCPRC